MQDISGSSGGTYASAINDSDEIVGMTVDDSGIKRAFIYSDGAITDLNTLIGSADALYTLQQAVAINNRGQIAVDGVDVAANHEAVFLLTPLKSSSRVVRDAPRSCRKNAASPFAGTI